MAWQRSMNLPRIGVFVGLYLFFSYLSIELIHKPGQVTLFWPASGVAFAFLVRYGLTWAFPLAAALALMHWLINPVPPLFLLFSISSNVVGAILAALYVRSYEMSSFLSLRSGFISLRAAILMALASSLIGMTGLWLSGISSYADFWPGVARWAMGDLLGIVCMAPVLLVLTAPASLNPDSPSDEDYAPVKAKLVWSVLLALSYVLIFLGGTSHSPYALGLTGLPIALLVWSAIQFQPNWTVIGMALTVLIITSMTGLGMAGFTQPRELLDVAFLLSFLVMIALFPLILLASNHESRISTRKIIRRATTDTETGLPNRTAFEYAARQALNAFGPAQTLAYLDFDHFTLVNDTASHEAGDELIKGIASMLAANLYPSDRIFRIGGDEFALLFMCEGREADLRAQRALRAIETYKTAWDGHVLSTTASIGLATLKPGHGDFAQLLSQADAACFTAKELGGNRICVAGQESTALKDRTEAMQSAILIRQALNGDYFELDCQDILPLTENPGNGRYFEVLLRLRDPHSGELLYPKSFIAAAERFHLGVKIDRYVINMLLSWMESHPNEAETVGACSINLSGASMDDEHFSGFLENRLKRSSFPADKIIFEITETCAMHDLSRAQALIGKLRGIGCRFALDDFGTGFCSFTYLQNLDVDIFKIDGSFVRDLETSQLSKAVIRSITDIAHVLNKTTTAEHCESLELIGLLRRLGVDHAQGFGIHKPQAIAEYFSRESLMIER
jgi:diguanylate cyclase (GGDEF)-like protein